jgi:hypothetical protein
MDEHTSRISAGEFTYFNPQRQSGTGRTFSLVYKVSFKDAQRISDVLLGVVPDALHRKLFFHPENGFHFTIQWTGEDEKTVVTSAEFINGLQRMLQKHTKLKGMLHLPFFGSAGLYGLLETDGLYIKDIRDEVDEIWSKFGLRKSIREEDYEIAWISLVRFTDALDEREIEQLRRVEIKALDEIVLDEIWLVHNDKVMSMQNTKIIKIFHLHKEA